VNHQNFERKLRNFIRIYLYKLHLKKSGLPQWTCTNTGDIAIIKIGWTRGSTNKSQTGAAAFERATVPSVVFPVTPANVLTL